MNQDKGTEERPYLLWGLRAIPGSGGGEKNREELSTSSMSKVCPMGCQLRPTSRLSCVMGITPRSFLSVARLRYKEKPLMEAGRSEPTQDWSP